MPILERLPLTDATRQWSVWGTTARIVVTQPELADAAQRLVADHLDAIDEACSRFRADSELAQAQRRLYARPDQPVPVSPLLADLIRAALRAAELTDGDVDPTLADDLAALGYDRDFAEIELATTSGPITIHLAERVRHRWTDIRLDGRRLLMPPGVHLDLGASAKAFAADTGAALVTERLGCGVLVALGGDIATNGPMPLGDHGAGWQVLVQDGPDEPDCQVRLDGAALATSSTLSRRWRDGTRAVHHILDPANGQPAEPVWRTVSVSASTCVEANALSTAAIVRGVDAVHRLRETGHAARLVGSYGEIFRVGGWPA
jgi:FAD:protein FMN transferase